MKGGARWRSGPPPDPTALRRDSGRGGEWIDLPPEGRTAPAPPWPLPDQTDREAELWVELWSMPQAVEWERHRLTLTVALYVRRYAEAEDHDAKVTLSTLVRQLGDGLGLTPSGMRALRWRITLPAPPVARAGQPADPSRARLRLLASQIEETETSNTAEKKA